MESERGHLKLCEGGFMYYRDRETDGDKVHWKCEFVKKFRCHARVTTIRGEIKSRWKEHNHIGNAGAIEGQKVSAAIREAAASSTDAPKVVIATAFEAASRSAILSLPVIRHLKRNITNRRRKAGGWTRLPKTRAEIDLRGRTRTPQNEEFLLFDSGADDIDRIIMFGTHENLSILRSCSRWYVDGTFECAPKYFYQMFTIHGMRRERIFPLVYALLPDKKKTTYRRVLAELKSLQPDLCPRSVMMDFEVATMKAFSVSNEGTM